MFYYLSGDWALLVSVGLALGDPRCLLRGPWATGDRRYHSIGAAIQNGMLDSNMVTEWTGIKITDAGISRDTPQLFCDLLVRHNKQRRVALSPMDLCMGR